MEETKLLFETKKIMNMGTVKEMTGLSERQIRYYEEKKLVFPERSPSGTRKYSLSDIRLLLTIAELIKKGIHTDSIRKKLQGGNLLIS